MKKLVLELNLFSFKQKVYLYDESDNSSTEVKIIHMKDGIDTELLALGEELGINHYHLFGVSPLVEKIANKMQNPEVSTYSMRNTKNDIIVEVN